MTTFASRAAAAVTGLMDAMDRLSAASSHIKALRQYRKDIDAFVKKPSVAAALTVIDSFNTVTATFKSGSKAQARFVLQNFSTMRRTIDRSGLSAALKAQLLNPLIDAKNQAQRTMDLLDLMNGKTVRIIYTGGTPTNPGGYKPGTPNVDPKTGKPKRALGGPVFGPGSGTSDSIPAMLSNGEYVIRAAAAQKLGYEHLDRLNRADRMPSLPSIVNAPQITLPATGIGRDAPLIGSMTVYPSSDVDLELIIAREARRQDRDRRTRHARSGR